MNTDIDMLSSLLEHLYVQIGGAAGRHDLITLQRLSRRAEQVESLKRQWTAGEEGTELQATRKHAEGCGSERALSPTGLRELRVEVTEGMVRQNLLTLTAHVKRGRIKPGEQLSVELLPSGDRLQTDLVAQGNRLRARGEIGQFYRDAGVTAGDFVVLTEVSPGSWILQKVPSIASIAGQP